MLIDALSAALNDLYAGSTRLLERYEWAAELLVDDPGGAALCAELRALAQHRRRDTDQLDRLIRNQDQLPSAPDPEAEAWHEAALRLKALAASEGVQVVLRDLDDAENALDQAIDRAMSQEPPPAVALVLDALRRRTAEARRRLAQLGPDARPKR